MGRNRIRPTRASVRRGRKRYFFAYPILSILLVATALAAPTKVTPTLKIYDDGSLTVSINVDQVLPLSSTLATVSGRMSVRNDHAFGVLLQNLVVHVLSENPTGVTFTIDITQGGSLSFPAHAKTVLPISGTVSGPRSTLLATTSFEVTATGVLWTEVYSGTNQNTITRSFDVTCTSPWLVISRGGLGSSTCTAL